MTIDACTTRKRVSKIVVEEKKRKVTFVNEDRAWYHLTQVDGCLCRQTEAADWAIKKLGVGTIIVELKGRDLPHAAKQVWASAKFWREVVNDSSQIAGLIVCRQRPSYSTSVQRLQTEFARKFKAPLHVEQGNKEHIFEEVLKFKRKP